MSNTSYLGMLAMPADDPSAKTMIKVDHVTMIFNIASEQLNSLKEYAIALTRRELRFKEFRALDDVSFEVKKGDVFGILGTNGSGKSTMLKIIAGVLDPSKGSCTVEGSIAPLIELGAGFDLELTARENIFLNGALLGYSKQFIQEHFDEIVEFAEVRDFLDMPMKNYSSGMVARIAFAIATVIVPDVLIVDEVLSVGDFLFQQKCERRIQSLINDHGVTVLIVSHSNEQIERLCNKAVWIEKGHLRAIGAAKEVCDLYRAIGGRPGSPEAEKTILETIDLHPEIPLGTHSCVFGETFYGTAIAMNSLTNSPQSRYILFNGCSEREGRIACGLSGLLGASLAATKPEQLPDILRQQFFHEEPREIIVIGNEEQVQPGVIAEVQKLCPNATVKRIESGSGAWGLEAYCYGAETERLWGNTAIVARDGYEAAMITLSSYAFANSVPTFYLDDSAPLAAIESVLKRFDRLILVGYSNAESLPIALPKKDEADPVCFDDPDPCNANDSVNSWLRDLHNSTIESDTAIVTDPYCELDNNLIGPFAGRMRSQIILISIQNLEEVAHGIKVLKTETNPPYRLLFVGSTLRYTDFDKALLSKALVSNPNFISRTPKDRI